MTLFFSAKVTGVGAVICSATTPMQFLPFRFSSDEQCAKFLRAVKQSGATLHCGMAHNELQAMVELWTAGKSPKRQPGDPIPMTRYVEYQIHPGEMNPIITEEQIDRAQGIEPANAPKLTLRGDPLDIVDRYKEKAKLQSTERDLPSIFYEKFAKHVDNAKAEAARLVEDRILEKLTPPTVSPGLIDHWLEGGGAEPVLDPALHAAIVEDFFERHPDIANASDIHEPVRSAADAAVEVYKDAHTHGTYEQLPGILRSMAEVVNHEEPRRVWKAVDPSPRDEDFA